MAKQTASIFDKVLQTAGGAKPETQKDDKPFYKEKYEDDDDDDGGESKSKSQDDDEDDEPQSFAERIRQVREQGLLNNDDEEEEPKIRKKKKKKAKKPAEEDDESYKDEVDIRIPKKSNEDSQEDSKEEEGKQKTEDETQDTDEKEDDGLSEEERKLIEDAFAIDPAKLTNKDGRPIVGEQASKTIKRLKGTIKHFAEELKKHKKAPAFDPNLPNELKQLKENHAILKKKFDDRYFEETPEWKNRFEKPFEEAALEAGKWIQSHDHADDSDELVELEQHRLGMQKALKEKNDVKFYEHADSIAEYLKKGAGSRFQNAVPKLWDAYWAREDARKEKEPARKAVTEELETFITSETKKAGSSLDVMIENFEKNNEKIINAYKTKPGLRDMIDYEGTITNRVSEVKKLIEQSIRTRAIPADLQKVIFAGILSGLQTKELDGLREALKQSKDDIARLEDRLKKKDDTLGRVKPSRSSSIMDDDDDDDEEDDDSPDFTTHFKKRMRSA